MSVILHPDIEQLDKSSLCYSIYSQLYLNFFNAQDRKDEEHPFGVVEGDETSVRLKNTAYGFASAIAGSVAGDGDSGETGGILLGYLKKSGGDMTGLLRAGYGFEAGIDNTRILSVYADRQVSENGEVIGTDYGIRIMGSLHVGGRHLFLGDRRVLTYDPVNGTAAFDAARIDFQVAKLQSGGEFVIGESREKGVFISPSVLQIGGKPVYHGGNANLETVDWSMLDGHVHGRLNVTGETSLYGRLEALYGISLGAGGKPVVDVREGEMALNGYLSFGTGYGIRINGIPVLFSAGEREIQLGSIGGDLLLGGEQTARVRLLSGISDTNGDYLLVSTTGDGYFPGSLTVRHNRGADLLSSYRTDADDEGLVIHKRLRFGTVDEAYLAGDRSGLSFCSDVIQYKEDKRIIQPCCSRIGHRLSGSLYKPLNRDSYTLYIDTDTDFTTLNTALEAKGHIGIDGSYTRLTDGALFFSEESRLQAMSGGVKHFGNSVFQGSLSSEMFSSGFAGSGWAVILNRTTGGVTATFDEVVARRKFRAYEFEVKKTSVTNGSLWISDSCSGDSVEKL